LQWEIGICRCERCNEGIFERLDGPFSGVDSMVVWLDKLEFAFFFGKKLLDKFCCLIVHDVDFRLVPLGLQHFEVSLVRVENTFVVQARNWRCQNCVGFIVV
jgi:hypothetical protein